MKLNKIGEFGLIEKILKKLEAGRSGPRFIIGPGDDAFAAEIGPKGVLVGTKDLLVEDIHFKREWTSPEKLGFKAMAVNLSDLAAMGDVKPLFAIVGIALPKDVSVEFVEKLYRGMNKAAREYNFAIAGGDTVSSKRGITLSITLLGSAKKSKLIRRSGAKPGDVAAVTGSFGDSGAGLWLLQNKIKANGKVEKYLVNKHLLPTPRFAQAKILSNYASSLIDSSDGFKSSIEFLTKDSKTGARINVDRLPLSSQLKKAALKYKGLDPIAQALSGGEDYELVFTLSRRNAARLKKKMTFTVIGDIVKGRKTEYFNNGKPYKKNPEGFKHFS